MAIQIVREVQASPERVLETIAKAGDWRESSIPVSLRSGNIIQVESRVRPPSFRITYVRKWYGDDRLEMRGTVSALTNGGSRVTAVCDYNRGLVPFLLILVALAIVSWFSGGSGVAALLGVALLVALGAFVTNRKLTRASDDEADYLVELLERSLETSSATDRASAPAI
jgi:hypothetical protein